MFKKLFHRSINQNFYTALSFFLSLCSTFISGFVFYNFEMTNGSLEIFTPTQIGTTSAKIYGIDDDKILICFTIYNNGCKRRTLKKISLNLNDSNSKIVFEASAMLDKLKDISKPNDDNYNPLYDNPEFHHIGSLPLNKYEFISLNLVFFSSNNKFKLNSHLKYNAILYIQTIDNENYTCSFNFRQNDINYKPLNNAINLNYTIF